MNNLENLIKLINSYPSDIKAEVLLADLILEGYTISDFLVFHAGLFKRGYSRDILKAERTVINKTEEMVGIHLARDGIYDLLPEGLFHETPVFAQTTVKEMAEYSKKESKVEEEVRKFFRPLENEFTHQSIELELLERSILQKLNDNSMENFFLQFWGIDRSLPRELSIKLSAMLPFVMDIVGDFQMTASCLGAILGENVTHKILYTNELRIDSESLYTGVGFPLGEACLGDSLITGGHAMGSYKLIRFSIGPLKNTGVEPYLEDGEITRFIECFCGFFIPLELEVDFDIIVQKELQGFRIDPDENQPIVGYSTVI